jgi:pyrroloquinoline quinone biosynthesis protein D
MNTVPDKPALSRLFRMQWEEAQGSYVLLYPEGMVKLNQSAAEILKRCDGQRDVPAIVDDLEQAFGVGGLRADVDDFLQRRQRTRLDPLSCHERFDCPPQDHPAALAAGRADLPLPAALRRSATTRSITRTTAAS